jgi:S1-C subfamily serine protease
MKNHLESAYRLAMVLLCKQPQEKDEAIKWLKFAAAKNHSPSINYLQTMFPGTYTPARTTPFGGAFAGGQNGVAKESAFASAQHSVVEISAWNRRITNSYTGIVISSTGFILTSARAVLDRNNRVCESIQIKRGNEVVNAEVIAYGLPYDGANGSVDLALLFAMDLMSQGCAELGNSNSYRNGDKVFLIDNSYGNGAYITSGVIRDSRYELPRIPYPYIMTDAVASKSNSGGPLISEDGQIIGVINYGIYGPAKMSYAIPIDVVKGFLKYVASSAMLPNEALGEIIPILSSPTYYSHNNFNGIHIALDKISFIRNIY